MISEGVLDVRTLSRSLLPRLLRLVLEKDVFLILGLLADIVLLIKELKYERQQP
jgi:hypothetical protein